MADIKVAQKWENIDSSIKNPVKNTNQDYLKFINSSYFNEEARRFMEYGYYTDAPVGSPDFEDYWDEQERRCFEGYSVGGVRITGRHYFFLNFGMMKARPFNYETGRSGKRKIITFPRFLDHQYYHLKELEECFGEGPYAEDPEHEKRGMIWAKGRRKGSTYEIASSVYAYNYNFLPASNNILSAYEKEHYSTTLKGIHFTINHLNKNTDWAKRQQGKSSWEHFRASYKYLNESNVEIEDGYMSEVRALSYKDNPFKGIGASCDVFGFEEAGRFGNLLEAYAFAEPLWRDGSEFVGVPLVWGTGGSMESGTIPFNIMFYDPKKFGLKAYKNIYDENDTGDCGFFIDNMWYYPGKIKKWIYVRNTWKEKTFDLVDAQGNSYRDLAEEKLDQKREEKKKGDKQFYHNFISQEPKNPKEAFMRTSSSPLPVKELIDHESNLTINSKKWVGKETIGELLYDTEKGDYKFEPDDSLIPITKYPLSSSDDSEGAIVIWEHPQRKVDNSIPWGIYIAGIDPYSDDGSQTTSLGSIIIMNRLTNRIVAEYTGKPQSINTFFENCRKLLIYYNAQGLYEANKKGIFSHFEKNNSLHLLANTPKYLKDKGLVHYRTVGNDTKGLKVQSREIILHGINLFKEWLTQPAQTENDEISLMNLHTIKSHPILQEAIYWNADDHFSKRRNYDRMSAIIQLFILKESMATMHMESTDQEEKPEEVLHNFFKKQDLFKQNILEQSRKFTNNN